MFCSQCGKQIADHARFCNHCGSPQASPQQPYQQTAQPYRQTVQPYVQPTQPGLPMQFTPPPYSPVPGLVGFSPRINDPAFARYNKSSSKYALVFGVVLAVIAMVGLPIYGSVSGEVEFPQSLYYGMIIGGMFLLIALVQTLRKGTDRTWDGVVIDKRSARRTQNDDDSGSGHHYTEYRFTVQRENGKKYSHTFRDQPAIYNYYQEGDRVRHHKGSTYYEKYDKSRDSEILCVACLTMNSISERNCRLCKCPLLKC